ncbi:MAG: SusC/RagA family TonB-linked outer membrane protein [Bacteroidales bacterium]|nr:SusC/RagA family TonB-linked outer membrane protein [Bacteroidales bacterium]MDD2425291.1 SusC/RagA family TonB-linked outer membrane protein [Bacteroidales bacterium]MDD3989655.1 SusC/RagA family TonB-linked outer membrane protein [Bacteroidales bacterium]
MAEKKMKKQYGIFESLFLKIVFSLMLLVIPLTSASAQGEKIISINVKEASLESILKQIGKKCNCALLYNYDEISKFNGITIDVTNQSVSSILTKVLSNTGLTHKINDNTIVISKNPVHTPETKRKINGKVVSLSGEPIAGANILVKGTLSGSFTDENGLFELTIDSKAKVIVASCVGFNSKELFINDITFFNIILEPAKYQLGELVVQTGYQSLSRRELASSVFQVDQEKINLSSKLSVEQMLSGQIPGMLVLQTSGEPSATPTIRIRGTSSIIGGRSPLWVLDGIILEDQVNVDVSDLNSPDAPYLIGNAIAGINPKDIETITVLKDASATAIYGSRAANGVIVVTTKKGRVGKPSISYSGNITLNRRIGYGDLQLMNSGERIKLSQEIIDDKIKFSRVPIKLGYEGLLLDYYNNNLTYDEFSLQVQKLATNNTDWYDILFRNSLTHNHSVNISGGFDRTTYYASLGYNKNIGTAKGSDSERFSGMAKVNSWLTKKFYIGFQINASNTRNNGFHSSVNPNTYAYETARTIACYNDDGTYFMYPTQQKSQTAINIAPKEELLYNIVNELNLTGSNSNITNLTAQLNLQYNFLPSLRYKLLGGFDQSRTNTQSWAMESSNYVSMIRRWNPGTLVQGSDDFEACPIPWGGIISNNDQHKDSYTLRNSVEYSEMLSDKHLVNLMVSMELRSIKYKGFSGTYYGWQPERGQTISPALTTGYYSVLSSLRPTITDNISNNVSWIGSATYSYKDKFTINANARADGSNNFGDNPQYRFLPVWSVAGKYTLSNENFLKDNSVIKYLAIRSSYGIQGNIDKATSPDLIIQVGSKNGITGMDESYFKYLPNPDLRWEQTNSFNAGLDFSLIGHTEPGFIDVISGSIDCYDKFGHEIIVVRRVSQVIGMDQVKVNGGKVRNSGIEGVLNITPYQTKDFNLSTKFIFSYNKNKLLEANKELNITFENKISGNALIEGLPLGSFYSYEFAGLNENYGFPMFFNNNGDRKYTVYTDEMNIVYSGVNIPSFSGGFELSSRYKGFHVSLNFQGAAGGTARLPNIYRTNYYAVFDPLANVTKDMNNRWKNPGDEVNTTIPVIWDNNKFQIAEDELNFPANLSIGKTPLEMYDRSTIRVAKTDNIRLRSINVSYVFPEDKVKKLGVESLILNAQAENIFILTDKRWLGRDPESGSSNTPIPKVFTFGLNIMF